KVNTIPTHFFNSRRPELIAVTNDFPLQLRRGCRKSRASDMNAKMPTFDYVDAILASTDQGLFLVETQDRVYHVNARLLELFAMKKTQIIGWTCIDLFHRLARLSQDTLRTERELRSALENIQQRPSVYLLSKREAIVSRL